ncbi:eCIS core domain-containing protein [Micromonospora sp. CA-248260]|uniref:eCIS core domain-containing protein n=1 Tax=Micromonospora sp. CA-248260 TaxID=3239962 RepID=UPI003D8EB36A
MTSPDPATGAGAARETAAHRAPPPTTQPAPGRDDALATLTRELVDRYAPSLGLRPDAVRVHLGAAGRRAANHGARGLLADGAVHLALGFDPSRAAGRALLVHELGHLAQATAGTAYPGQRATDPEGEARALADAASAGRALWTPVARLPAGVVAADTGAVATRRARPARRPPTGRRPTRPGPARWRRSWARWWSAGTGRNGPA